MTLHGESEESLLLRSVALDLEQYLINTLRAQELSEKTGVVDPRIGDFAKRGLGLIDAYMLHKSYLRGQLSLTSRPMNFGAVLTQVEFEVKQFAINPDIRVIIDKKQPLVMGDFAVVKEVIKSLVMFLASFEGNQQPDKKITIQSYSNGGEARVGVFSEVSLSTDNFAVEKSIKSNAKMPLSIQSGSALPEYYLAGLLCRLHGAEMALTKRKNLYGFSLSLDQSQQLSLI